jgi:hypothetical protein
MQYELQKERSQLEADIMARMGQNDESLWSRLIEVRAEIDSLYEEKLLLVRKMYNLGQKFVQELEVQN